MRAVAILLFVVAAGGVAGGCGGDRVTRACEHLKSLCPGDVDVESCKGDPDEGRKVMGADNFDKMIDCVSSAQSCPEAVGCALGGVEKMGNELERGLRRMQN